MVKTSKKEGFTLIEMLVIISVTLILSTILIGYSREMGRQLLLVSNQAKIVNIISRAKSLSTATFLETPLPVNPGDPRICGYGVHVERNSGDVFIFRDMDVDCTKSDQKFASGDVKLTSQLDTFLLDSKVAEFTSATSLDDILFIPPDPTVIINHNVNKQDALIEIQIKDKSSKVVVKVNNAGRISTK